MQSNLLQTTSAMTVSLLVIACLAALATTGSAATHSTTVSGRVFCRFDGQSVPMQDVMIRVFDNDFLIDTLIASTETGDDGTFSVDGEARDFFGVPDIYVAVVHTYSTLLEVDGLFGIPRFHVTPSIEIADVVDFGDIIIADDHCRAYVQFYNAINDYTNRTGVLLPYETLHVCTHAAVHAGVPYALLDKAFVPEDYPLNLETAKHELAHTVRHTLDGNFGHLTYDAIRFNYFQQHYCGLQTNEGFAFNEGWAQFWAGSCTASFYGVSEFDYTIEGNVAIGLRGLQASYGLSDFDMVDVLDGANATIHSFYEYESAVIASYSNGY